MLLPNAMAYGSTPANEAATGSNSVEVALPEETPANPEAQPADNAVTPEENAREDKAKEEIATAPKHPLARAADAVGSSLAVDLKITPKDSNPDGTPKTSFLTGETINAYNSIDVSGDDINLVKPYVVVSIPKEFVKYQPVTSNAASLDSFSVTSNTEKNTWEIKYVYNALVGGQSVAVPFNFKFTPNTTPNGAQAVLTQELFSSDGTKLKENQMTFTAETSKPFVQKFEVKSAPGGVPLASNPKVIDPDITTPVKFVVQFKNYQKSGMGIKIGTYRVYEILPEGSRFSNVPENDGWTYDPANHIAYRDIETDKSFSDFYDIYLDFPNYEYYTKYKNTAAVVGEDEEGNLPATPPTDAVSSTADFSLVPTQYMLTVKSSDPGLLYKIDKYKDAVTTWTIKPKFNVENAGPISLTEIRDTLRDTYNQMESFTLNLPTGMNIGENTLVGILPDKTEEVIETNISAGTKYNIDKKYTGIVLKFKDHLVVNSIEEGNQISAILTTRFNQEKWDDPKMIGFHGNEARIIYVSPSTNKTVTTIGSANNKVEKYEPTFYNGGLISPTTFYVDTIGEVSVNGYQLNDPIIPELEVKKNPKVVVLLPG